MMESDALVRVKEQLITFNLRQISFQKKKTYVIYGIKKKKLTSDMHT